MKQLFKYSKTDKIIKLSMSIAAILLLIQALSILSIYRGLPPFIPLFNQLPWGEERLGTKIEIFLPFFLSCSFLIFNLLLLNRLYERVPLVSRILSITTLLITALALIFIIQTLQIIL